MKREAMSLLLALSLAAASVPMTCAAADELVLAPSDGSLSIGSKDPDDPENILNNLNKDNAAMLESLGKKNWEELAKSVQLTGKWADDLIAVAQTQVGYTQEDDGMTLYTRWAECKEPTDWNTLFLGWTAAQIGLSARQFPQAKSYDELYKAMDKLHAVKKIARATYPGPGDLAIIQRKDSTLVGIVVYVSGGYASVIHGDDNGRVTRETYLVNGAEFKKFVDLTVLMERAGVDTGRGGDVPVIPEGGIAAWTNTNAVYLRSEPTTASKSLTTVKKSGTALRVTSAEMQEDGYVWFGVTYKDRSGYIRGDLLRLDESALAPKAEATPVPDQPMLGVQSRVVNVEVLQAGANQLINITFDIYGATAYEWHEVRADEEGSTDRVLPGEDRATLTITAKNDAAYSYYCVAIITANGKSVEVTSKTTALSVLEDAAAPIAAEAILGEEVNFTYAYEGAAAYQWSVDGAPIPADSEVYTGADTNRLTFHAAAEHAGSRYECLALDAKGNTLQRSVSYTLAIQDLLTLSDEDLRTYADELAHMTLDQRYTALAETWNIPAVINGRTATLAEAVRAYWAEHLLEVYPQLLCTCGIADAPGTAHRKSCPWHVTAQTVQDPDDPAVYRDCRRFTRHCAIITSWITRNATPLEIYTYLSAMSAQDRTELLRHASAAHPQAEDLLCRCMSADAQGNLTVTVPGAAHAHGEGSLCPWYSAEAEKSGLVPVTDPNGSVHSYALVLLDANGTPNTVATTTCLDGVRHYLRDAQTGVYVAYLQIDEDGQAWIIPLSAEG